ncbi:MAG: hypothetical protein JSW67_00860 [Candidatus Latescibacterota bacterium]|nr:MAG: hypothetical protein JSW67_00860 [Candidatus Latescibacterota bacterium]
MSFLLWVILLLCCAPASGAQPGGTAAGAAAADRIAAAQVASAPSAPPDSMPSQSGNRFTRLVSDYLFVGSPAVDEEAPVEVVPSEQPHVEFRGRVIRSIEIQQVEMFGYYDPATGRVERSSLGQIGDAVHVDTRTRMIRKYLLMREGDLLDPFVLADSERLLRSTPFILDARIEVLPVPGVADTVDVLVITRDRFSIGVDMKVHTSKRYRLNLKERNFMGFGHQIEFQFDVDLEADQRVGLVAGYVVDNLGGSWVNGEYRYFDNPFEKTARVLFSRQRVAPQIRYIGALELANLELKANGTLLESQTWDRTDVWLGRSFPLGANPGGGLSRTALTPAVRVEWIDFHQRPLATASMNRGFLDRVSWLASLSLNQSRFRKSRLIRGYGRTEDIPYGFLFGATAGWVDGELEDRFYADTRLRVGSYTDGFGYFTASVGVGSFWRAERWEDVVASFRAEYFSPLAVLGRYRFRQFAAIRGTHGFRRRESNEGIALEGINNPIAVTAQPERGTQRLVMGLESVLFTPYNLWGFKFAPFGFLATATLGNNFEDVARGSYTSSVGFGLRFHNERLIFDPFELRFGFLLNGPEGTAIDSFRLGSSPTTSFVGFEPGAPSTLPYR